MKNHIVYLSTGSNIGDSKQYLMDAYRLIVEDIGPVVRHSSIYEAEPWGIADQKGFFNQVLCVECQLSPMEVLEKINLIEQKMGRVRIEKWAERTIDIDILFYDDAIIRNDELSIPHPHIHERNFVLVPFLEIAPELIHPELKRSIRELYFECTDTLNVYLN